MACRRHGYRYLLSLGQMEYSFWDHDVVHNHTGTDSVPLLHVVYVGEERIRNCVITLKLLETIRRSLSPVQIHSIKDCKL